MAIIYPKNIDMNIVRNNSKAEEKILNMFYSLDKELTKDWIVFYSYSFKGRTFDNLSNVGYDFNEIDFLLLLPNIGFFILEVKGGRIEVEDGQIYSCNAKGRYLIDPYNQGKRNYYALSELVGKIKRVNNRDIYLKNVVSGTLVAFPDISIIPSVGLLSDRIDTFVSGMSLYDFIINYANIKKVNNNINLTKIDINKVINILNGYDYQYSLSAVDYISNVKLALKKLTKEQEVVFNGLFANKRCIIKGCAGSGKTVLAQFLFKHLTTSGLSCLYLTFNKNIINVLNKELKSSGSKVCDFTDFINSDFNTLYDCLILDEAQDIDLKQEYLRKIDSTLFGGLKDGYCYIFYDNKQDIIKSEYDNIYEDDIFYDDGYRYARFSLNQNCRNSFGIAKVVNMISTANELNSVTKFKDYTSNEFIYKDASIDSVASEIKKVITKLVKDGVNYNQIAILFNETENNTIIRDLSVLLKDKFSLLENTFEKNNVTYSSVTSFKGLEKDVIIYVINSASATNTSHYVAISRAKVFCFVFNVED